MIKSIFAMGEKVNGISYPVLDEREIRGSAGLMFLLGLVAFIPLNTPPFKVGMQSQNI